MSLNNLRVDRSRARTTAICLAVILAVRAHAAATLPLAAVETTKPWSPESVIGVTAGWAPCAYEDRSIEKYGLASRHAFNTSSRLLTFHRCESTDNLGVGQRAIAEDVVPGRGLDAYVSQQPFGGNFRAPAHAWQLPNAGSARGNRPVALAWLPPDSGTATSYILEAGTTPGASDLFAGSIGLATSLASEVGPGTYYIRVRAVNAEGVSPPSNEVTLIVGDGPPGKPTVTSAGAAGSILTISWESGSGPTPSAHRLDFSSAAGPVASLNYSADTELVTPIPPSTMGTFNVTVTAFNEDIAGPASEPFTFTVESVCNPMVAPDVSGGVTGGMASVSWPSVPGATSYILSAGSTPGGTQFLPETDIGANTSASASVAAGFTAWVRVIAVNACGHRSAPRDFLVQ